MMKAFLPALLLSISCAASAADPVLAARDASWNSLRQQGDAATLERLIDPGFVLVHSDGRVQYRSDYLDELRTRKRVNGEIRNEDVVIREYGDSAVGTA